MNITEYCGCPISAEIDTENWKTIASQKRNGSRQADEEVTDATIIA
jgi:hypothetical protein